MTNFGIRAILALPLSGPGADAEWRLLAIVETFPPEANGDRFAGLALVAEQAGLPYISARRARDRLVARGLISFAHGQRGRGATWRLLFPIGDHLSEHQTERLLLSQGEHQSGRLLLSQGEHQSAIGDQPGRATLNDRSVITRPRIGAHPGRAPALKDSGGNSLDGTADRERARDDDAQPDWQRGPGQRVLSGKVYAPGHGPGRDTRPTPTPPTWTAPRSNPAPEIAERGASLARALLADRQRPPGAPPPRPRTDDERRALALRQARQSRREREPTLTQEAAAVMTEPAESYPPERDLGEPPTPPLDDEPVIFEPPDSGEGPPDECPF